MKKLFKLMTLTLCCTGAFFASSCTDTEEGGGKFTEITAPFESVTAVDGASTATAVISDADKTIKFEFNELTDISAVSVTFNMAKGALRKTPAESPTTLNLDVPQAVVLHNGIKEVTYTLTAKAKVIPLPVIEASVSGEKAEISGQTITIPYKSTMNINAMVLDLTMETGATVKTPTDKTFDLESNVGSLVVTFMNQDFTYTIAVKDYTDPLLSKGWTNETANFGVLPSYIKVYKHEDMLNNPAAKSRGYIAVIGSKATMGALGTGMPAVKNIYDFSKQEQGWKVLLVGINSTATQLILRDSRFIQEAALWTFGTIGQDASGQYKMAWSKKFDDKLYSFPFKQGTTYVERPKTEGAIWAAKTAVSGLVMILWDGNPLTQEQVICNTGINYSYFDGAYAQSAIGMTASGKIVTFCSQQVNGSAGITMLNTANIMKDAGCVSAMVFERSGTPDMLINGLKTVENDKVFAGGVTKAKAVQAAIAFK